MAFSDDGTILFSGCTCYCSYAASSIDALVADDATVGVWDVKTGRMVDIIDLFIHGAVHAVLSVKVPETNDLAVAAGTADGNITVSTGLPGRVSGIVARWLLLCNAILHSERSSRFSLGYATMDRLKTCLLKSEMDE